MLAEPKPQTDSGLKDSAMRASAQGTSELELDLRLPKVSAGLVLLSQCLTTMLFSNQNAGDTVKTSHPPYPAVLDSTLAAGFIESVVGEAFKITLPTLY